MEIWKDLAGYEGCYQVSNYGRLYSYRTGKYFTGSYDKDGYKRTTLTNKDGVKKTEKIHRLVAMMFCEKPEGATQVNHKDENKANNHADNLEWCNAKYNCNYGKHSNNISNSKCHRLKVYKNGEFIGEFNGSKSVAEALNYNINSIERWKLGIVKSKEGYTIEVVS